MKKIIKSRNEKFGLNLFVSLILISICLILLIFPASAKVHISSTYYNSDTIVTEDITTINAQYQGATILMPTFIISGGAGKSVDEEFSEFSHSIFAAMDGKYEKIGASLKTESGEYEWKSGINASSDLVMGMSVEYEIENGNLEASYSNSDSTVSENLIAESLQYSGSAVAVPNAINVAGAGKSEQDVESSGFSHETCAENNGKWVRIETNLESTSVNYNLSSKVQVIPQGVLVAVLEKGDAEKGHLTTEMIGTGSKFPLQYLPPGKTRVKTTSFILGDSNIDENIDENIKENIEKVEGVKDILKEYMGVSQEEDPVDHRIPLTNNNPSYEEPPQPSYEEPSQDQSQNLVPFTADGKFVFGLKMAFIFNNKP